MDFIKEKGQHFLESAEANTQFSTKRQNTSIEAALAALT
jgi:hypothetical protein